MGRIVWGSDEDLEGINVGIVLWKIINPTITVFEGDMEEWLDIVAKELAIKASEKVGKRRSYYSELKGAVRWAFGTVIYSIRERIYTYMVRNIVIMEGKFGMGERAARVVTKTTFFSDLDEAIEERALRVLLESVETGKEIEKPEKSSEDTYFEYTLNRYIPTIFTPVLKLWQIELSMGIAKKLLKMGYEGMAAKVKAKEILTLAMERTVEVLERVGAEYVNIVSNEASAETLTGKLITVSEFIDKLYKLVYGKIFELLESGMIKKGE